MKDSWAKPNDLADALDVYFANCDRNERPKASAIGMRPQASKPRVNGQPSEPTRTSDTPRQDKDAGTPSVSVPPAAVARNAEPEQESSSGGKRCFRCRSTTHLVSSCPLRGTARTDGPANNRKEAHVNRCVKEKVETDRRVTGTAAGDDTETGSVTGPITGCNVTSLCRPETNVLYSINEVADVLRVDGVDGMSFDHRDNSRSIDLAKLNYVDVNIMGRDDCVVSALADSGSEINVAKRDILSGLDLIPFGSVQLRGILGAPVEAELVHLKVRLADEMSNDSDFVSIVCAVCDNVNTDFILTGEIVDRLRDMRNSKLMSSNVACDELSVDLTVANAHASAISDSVNCDMSVDDYCGEIFVDPVVIATGSEVASSDCADFVDVDNTCDNAIPFTVDDLKRDQLADDSLSACWRMARRGKGRYYVKNELLYRIEKQCGQSIEALCVPRCRRGDVLRLAHESAHWAARKTRERILISGLTWPTLTSEVKQYVGTCDVCQKRARITYLDRVPIAAIPRDTEVFRHWFMDCAGPFLPSQKVPFNYVLILIDSASRYPFAYPLRSLTARSVCDALLNMFAVTGVASDVVISSDNGSNFTAALTQEVMRRLGISPVFSTPAHPNACGLVERAVGTMKGLISKLAFDFPRSWHKYLCFVLWAMRETPNETTNCPPYLLVFGKLPKGPLAILRETWIGEREAPPNSSKSVSEYLDDLREKLQVAQHYAEENTTRAQKHYVDHYNLRSRDKHFAVGDKCLLLQPTNTASKVFSRWRGPGEIVEVLSPYSYIVEFEGVRHHVHANRLRRYCVRVDEVVCDSFIAPLSEAECCCTLVRENDIDFGDLQFVDTSVKDACEAPPSEKIRDEMINHLQSERRHELLRVLDKYPEVFSEKPGLCNAGVYHRIPVVSDFRPKRLKAYRVPEKFRPEVDKQISELLRLGFIEPSDSPMASPIVCVMKGKAGEGGIRVVIDYRYVNKYTVPDVTPLPDIADLIQRIGRSNFISCFDAKSGYHQIPVWPADRWLTAFVCDAGLFQWCRAPFGMRSSGCSFVRALADVLRPVRGFTDSYVDDMAVHSDVFQQHLSHLDSFLAVMKDSGLTLGLNKCSFAQNEVKFVGHIIGSGKRRVDPEKVESITALKEPETKKQLRQVLGFFLDFSVNIYLTMLV